MLDVQNYAFTSKDVSITIAYMKFLESLQENCFWVAVLQMPVNQCMAEFFKYTEGNF